MSDEPEQKRAIFIAGRTCSSAVSLVFRSHRKLFGLVFQYQKGIPCILMERIDEALKVGFDKNRNGMTIVLPSGFRSLQCAPGGRIDTPKLAVSKHGYDSRLPFHLAIADDEVEIVLKFLKYKPEFFTPEALYCATNFNRMEILGLLVDNFEKSYSKEASKNTYVRLQEIAFRTNNLDILVVLQEKGITLTFYNFKNNVDKAIADFVLTQSTITTNPTINTLKLAVNYGNIEVLEKAISLKQQSFGWDDVAANLGRQPRLDVVQLVIKKLTRAGRGVLLDEAAMAGSVHIVDYVVDLYGATPSTEVFTQVIKGGHRQMLEWLINHNFRGVWETSIPVSDVVIATMLYSMNPDCMEFIVPTSPEVANFFVQHGIPIDTSQLLAPFTRIFEPIRWSRSEMLEFLQKHSKITFPFIYKFRLAAELNDGQLLNKLKEELSFNVSEGKHRETFRTFLLQSIWKNGIEAVKFFHENCGARLEADFLGIALSTGDSVLIMYLLDRGQDMKWTFPENSPPYKIFEGLSPEVLERLVVQCDFPYKQQVFRRLASFGFVEPLDRLMCHIGELDCETIKTAVDSALSFGAVDMTKYLIKLVMRVWSEIDQEQFLASLMTRLQDTKTRPNYIVEKYIRNIQRGD